MIPNLISTALSHYRDNGFMALFARVANSIICCRILQNLRQAAEWRGDLPDIQASGIVFAATPGRQTNQTEMSRLEVSGTRSDDEGHRLWACRILLGHRHSLVGEAESDDSSGHSQCIGIYR